MKNSDLIIGSHVSLSSPLFYLGTVKEALSYNSTAFMFYTGAPQNSLRLPLSRLRIEEGRELLKENNFNENNSLIIWCPFDKEFSYYVKTLSQIPYAKVIYSHIDNGENFFYYEPDNYHIIISNPPFSQKDNILKRLDELNKPYAMLLPIPTLQGQGRFPYLKNIQYLGFDKRINYYKDISMTKTQDGVSFGSCYLCKKFLPKDLIIEELIK